MADRFTAVLTIHKSSTPPRERGYTPGSSPVVEHETSGEVAKVVVRADTLDALKTRIAAHVALVEE